MTTMTGLEISLILLLAKQFGYHSAAANKAELFRRVKVSKAQLTSSNPLEFPSCHGLSQYVCCSNMCIVRPRCQLFCHEPSTASCILSYLLVSPDYAEANMDDALICYTRHPKDLATGASIQDINSNEGYPERVKDNLVDGITDVSNADHWYMSGKLDYPWILLDFGEPTRVRLVRVFLQDRGNIRNVNRFSDMEVRTGMNPVDSLGDFSSYGLFATFKGPATEFGQEIVFEVPTPVMARFLSLQKVVNDQFQITHLEIF